MPDRIEMTESHRDGVHVFFVHRLREDGSLKRFDIIVIQNQRVTAHTTEHFEDRLSGL